MKWTPPAAGGVGPLRAAPRGAAAARALPAQRRQPKASCAPPGLARARRQSQSAPPPGAAQPDSSQQFSACVYAWPSLLEAGKRCATISACRPLDAGGSSPAAVAPTFAVRGTYSNLLSL